LGEDKLGEEAFLVAFGGTQSLFILFDFDFDPAAELIAEMNVGNRT